MGHDKSVPQHAAGTGAPGRRTPVRATPARVGVSEPEGLPARDVVPTSDAAPSHGAAPSRGANARAAEARVIGPPGVVGPLPAVDPGVVVRPRRAAGSSAADASSAVEPVPEALVPEIPPEELPLDPRAIARASLAAGRNASLWWVAVGVVVSTGVALIVGTSAGSTVLALLLVAGAIARALMPEPGPAAFVVRARTLDVLVLFSLALGLAVLSQLLPAAA